MAAFEGFSQVAPGCVHRSPHYCQRTSPLKGAVGSGEWEGIVKTLSGSVGFSCFSRENIETRIILYLCLSFIHGSKLFLSSGICMSGRSSSINPHMCKTGT